MVEHQVVSKFACHNNYSRDFVSHPVLRFALFQSVVTRYERLH